MTLSFYQHTKSQTSKAQIGKEAYRLTTLLDAGFPVPKGFIASAETCRAFFSHGNLEDKIRTLLSRCNFHDPSDLARVSKNIRKLILSAEMPSEAAQSLLEASVKLSGERVMLTASPITSHDGVHDQRAVRRFGIEGEANILLGIRELWASQFSPDELYYIYTAQDHEFPCMAVCVQTQPRAIATGILYTTNPSDKHDCTLHMVWGEGAYHQKLLGADTYSIEKDTGIQKEIARTLQPREYVWIHGELEELVVPQSRQRKQKLSPIFYKKVASLARDIQQKLFFPQEVTFLFDGKSFLIIDARPIVEALRTTEHLPSPQTKHILLKGVGVTPGIVTGMVRVVRGPHEKDIRPSEIVVAHSLSHIANEILRSAKGIIVEEETPSSARMNIANKGIAFLMSAVGAVDLLEPGSFITLHTPRGEVSQGTYTNPVGEIPEAHEPMHASATHVGTIRNLGNLSIPQNIHGHLILSPKSVITEVGIHPLKLARERKTKVLTQKIVHAITQVCEKNRQTPLLFDISHLTTSEYRMLGGGTLFETLEEKNPLLGYWGANRIINNPELIEAELEAIATIRRQTYGKELSILIPPSRTAYEVLALQKVLIAHKINRSASCHYYLNLSIPSLLWQIPNLSSSIDGIVLDLDTVASYLFALDPHADVFHFSISDIEPSIFAILKEAYAQAKNEGLHLIVRGKLVEHDPFLSFIVSSGIHEVIVPPGNVQSVTNRLIALEQEHISHV